MNSSQLFLLILACILFGGCGASPTAEKSDGSSASESSYAIRNVHIISGPQAQMMPDQTVLISDDKISKLGDATRVEVPSGYQIIDGSGRFLVPGLAEMHAHIPVAENGDDEYVKEILFLYLSNGITTIRGMLGNPYHLSLQEDVASGKILGPRIFTSGPSFNGTTCPTPERAREMVRQQAAAGYDFLKLHPGLKLEVFNALVEAANQVGIGFAGHVSVDVGIRRALEAKYLSVDHIDGYVEGLVPASAGVDPNENGFFGLNFTAKADVGQLDDLVSLTVENGVWVVPTQSLFERWGGLEGVEVLADQPEMKYIPKSTLANWIERKTDFMAQEVYTEETVSTFLELRRKMIYELYHGGAMLASGSDAPQVFNVPGFSIHHEFQSYVLSGLTPQEVLEIGTSNPARYFEMEDQFGSILPGSSADLILLDKNPLEEISNLKNPAGVMVRGRWLPRKEIEARLDQIASKYKD